MMDLLTLEELKTLITPGVQSPRISWYLPMVKAGDETRQNPIRYKNILRETEDRLEEAGMRKPDAIALLEPAKDLLNNGDFWQNQGHGLAVFLAPDFFKIYRLPLEFEEFAMIGEDFNVKPLLPLFSNDGRFFILALSQNDVRLLEATRQRIGEIELEDIPRSLEEALRFDDAEEQLRFRTSEGGPGGSIGGPTTVMFHGQGGRKEVHKTNILRFFQDVDRGLMEILAEERSPMILAGVDYLLPIYRQASAYQHLLDETITGNPEEWRDEELHRRGWEIVEPYFRKEQEEAADLYQRLAGKETGRSSSDISEIAMAAYIGKVGQVFLPAEIELWGRFDPQTGSLRIDEQPGADSQDLYNFVATQTILNGGEVYAVKPDELPDAAPCLAIFRYE